MHETLQDFHDLTTNLHVRESCTGYNTTRITNTSRWRLQQAAHQCQQTQCSTCKTEQGLSRCQACLVVFYCGREHQTSDWPQHKTTCKHIKKSRYDLASGVQIMNSSLLTRYAHVEYLLEVKNRTAVQMALDHLLDILRSNRSDDMGIRGLIPSLYLRLGQDSACYDYLKWWALRGKDVDKMSDRELTKLPFLDIKDADAFESLDEFNIEYFNVTLRNMLLLLKWRLLCDVQALDKARYVASGEQLAKLLDQIRSHILSSATKKNAALMKDVDDGKDLSAYLNNLES
jgi:hypothetical protein